MTRLHYNDVTWTWWRLISPAIRFVQLLVHVNIKNKDDQSINQSINQSWKEINIPLWGESYLILESTGDRWIPFTKGRWCGKRFHAMTESWGNRVLLMIDNPRDTAASFSGDPGQQIMALSFWSVMGNKVYHYYKFIVPTGIALDSTALAYLATRDPFY